MGTYIEPFDFEKIFLQYFIGNNTLFFFIFLILTSYICAKYQMSNRNYLIILLLGSIMFAAYLTTPVYFIIFTLVGAVLYLKFT